MQQNTKNVPHIGKDDYDLTQKTPLVSSRILSSKRKGKKSQLLKIPDGFGLSSRSRYREIDALKSASAIERIDEEWKVKKAMGSSEHPVSPIEPEGLSRTDTEKVKDGPMSNLKRWHLDGSTERNLSPTALLTAKATKRGPSKVSKVNSGDSMGTVMTDTSRKNEGGETVIVPPENARGETVAPPVVPCEPKSTPEKEGGSLVANDSAIRSIHEKNEKRNNLKLDMIVLKFTTMSEGTNQQSYVVGRNGASIGRGKDNTICIQNDVCMSKSEHAIIEWREGSFYLLDQGQPYAAAIQIGMGNRPWDWPITVDAMFSAGSSIFRVSGFDKEGYLMLEILSGPLKGELRRIPREGATLGRSTDNAISIPDRELSRKHSMIQWLPDGNGLVHPYSTASCSSGKPNSKKSGQKGEELGGFYLTDVGSTNGSYMWLVGLYDSSLRLGLSDHILLGRTGFSINRFDWGIWEDRGVRRTMEDKSVIFQHIGVEELNAVGLSPQTYMAIYDGHGGIEAAEYLWQHLHLNIADALGRAAPRIIAAAMKDKEGRGSADGDESLPTLDEVIGEVVKESFIQTDAEFIATSSRPQCGSTATTVIILGNHFYSFNVGDSRTILCQKNGNIITSDHKPSREDEYTRIKEAGGLVINKRVMGELAVSRAFGDKEFKVGIKSILSEGENGSGASSGDAVTDVLEEKSRRDDTCRNASSTGRDWKEGERPEGEEIIPEAHAEAKSPKRCHHPRQWSSDSPLITAEPEMLSSTLSQEDEFVLLACDGLFDVYSTEEVIEIVRTEMALDGDVQRTCEVLTERAISKRYSRDNVSVVLMVFSDMQQRKPKDKEHC